MFWNSLDLMAYGSLKRANRGSIMVFYPGVGPSTGSSAPPFPHRRRPPR